ncbi:hypothetical protein GCM10027290_14960 [Micromonospora sonneratiae]|uniref:DUF2178 domain-containing protein n=1 Tax=Micromonospora sonneratiae TaxID=1184706 RepID=A0ABW3YEZ2_9ACTN
MAFEEKRVWVMILVTIGFYVTYVVVLLGRAQDTPLPEVPYVAPLLWSVGGAIMVSIVLHVAISIVSPEGANEKDQRDREINRAGEYIGQSFVVVGGVAALGMALARWDHFWIANVIYLCFVLSAIVGSTAKIVAYRRGFQAW